MTAHRRLQEGVRAPEPGGRPLAVVPHAPLAPRAPEGGAGSGQMCQAEQSKQRGASLSCLCPAPSTPPAPAGAAAVLGPGPLESWKGPREEAHRWLPRGLKERTLGKGRVRKTGGLRMRERKEIPTPRFCLLASKSLQTCPLLLLSPLPGPPHPPSDLPSPLSTPVNHISEQTGLQAINKSNKASHPSPHKGTSSPHRLPCPSLSTFPPQRVVVVASISAAVRSLEERKRCGVREGRQMQGKSGY